jgi:hypothetical protein
VFVFPQLEQVLQQALRLAVAALVRFELAPISILIAGEAASAPSSSWIFFFSFSLCPIR